MSHPAIDYAIKVHRAINRSHPRQRWANLEIIQSDNSDIEPIVRMEIGQVNFNGVKQASQICRTYHYDGKEVFWTDRLHS